MQKVRALSSLLACLDTSSMLSLAESLLDDGETRHQFFVRPYKRIRPSVLDLDTEKDVTNQNESAARPLSIPASMNELRESLSTGNSVSVYLAPGGKSSKRPVKSIVDTPVVEVPKQPASYASLFTQDKIQHQHVVVEERAPSRKPSYLEIIAPAFGSREEEAEEGDESDWRVWKRREQNR